ncbi:uncharacterized protein LOC123421933 [Hordeum vulgare subsp. vulgare]|nr:uncharacterized protein LOC123421933 [Hordeum vulgare subsp. vulgare]
MTLTRRAALACRSARRLLSTSGQPRPAPSTLLGHFHHPMWPQDAEAFQLPPLAAPVFQPLTPSSPSLSIDFLPDVLDYALHDSHLGLVLLRRKPQFGTRGFLVCDPVSRRHAQLPPPPISSNNGGVVIGAALLSRAPSGGGLQFEILCVALEVDRPRAWIASYHDGRCRWAALAPSRGVTLDLDHTRFERVCVHAAGGMYWHVLHSPAVLALDTASCDFSFLPAPALMWGGDDGDHKYRIGEMPEDGRLCIASLERRHGLQICVRAQVGATGDNGWVLDRRVPMEEVLDTVPSLPKDRLLRHSRMWLGDMDAGRTGKVFINTIGFGNFSYDIIDHKLEPLTIEDGTTYGHPVFAYIPVPAPHSRST